MTKPNSYKPTKAHSCLKGKRLLKKNPWSIYESLQILWFLRRFYVSSKKRAQLHFINLWLLKSDEFVLSNRCHYRFSCWANKWFWQSWQGTQSKWRAGNLSQFSAVPLWRTKCQKPSACGFYLQLSISLYMLQEGLLFTARKAAQWYPSARGLLALSIAIHSPKLLQSLKRVPSTYCQSSHYLRETQVSETVPQKQ